MRLHHLSVTAFGPFAGTVTVDFDELSSAGLFLLTGATGAGKTSVLDAVCFALYGQVPGDRAGAKHLRSDHAAPDVPPEVELRLSIGERQLTFTRSPAWMRPKLRGVGETKVQAHVLVSELRNGSWTVLTNRLDDAGLLVTELLGMSCNQFTQVAMLPQGRFQAFLRATSAERHAVLQQLFRTDRFERIEHWLVDRRTQARRTSEAASAGVLETLNRLREAVGADEDPDWWGDLATAADSGAITSWTAAATTDAGLVAESARSSSELADLALVSRGDELAAARATTSLRRRGLAARAELERYAGRSDELAELRRLIGDHRRAAPLAALAASTRAARRTAAAAADRWGGHHAMLLTLVGEDLSSAAVGATLRRAQDAHALAVGFAPRERFRRTGRDQVAGLLADLQQLETGIAEIELVLAEQPVVINEAAAAVQEARYAATRLPVVAAAVERAEIALAAARRAELVGLELAAARTDVLTATAAAQQAREIYLDLREARINGMASELAGQLASGCSCPVCGSAEHPAPARSASTAVGRADEESARKTLDDAEFEVQARQVVVATLVGELANLDEQLGTQDRATLAGALDRARDEAERLTPLVAALDVLLARETECRAHLAAAQEDHRAALLTRAQLQVRTDQAHALLAAAEEEWTTLLAVPGAAPEEHPGLDLDTVVEQRDRSVAVLDAGLRALEELSAAEAQASDLERQLADACAGAGFESTGRALAALLTDDQVHDLEHQLSEAELAARAADLTLADPEVEEALEALAPDLDAAVAAHETATRQARSASSALAGAEARRSRIAELSEEVDTRLHTWAPLREQHRTVAELSAFVEGKGLDNPARMRLAAYVLAERLRQVVAAANERLATMTEHRYSLEHSDDRGYGEQRGGLSLRVRDDWNGVQRDPATLSGGETFVVSLALALGLADTVAHEAGGTDIDTLFIDEGFGSLDSETLEDVMDTLDSLRDGGRVVGLVSHVPELRSRITSQLEVSKTRNGSTLAAVTAAG